MKLVETWRRQWVQAEVVRAIEQFAFAVAKLALTHDIEHAFDNLPSNSTKGRMLAEIALDDALVAAGKVGLSISGQLKLQKLRYQGGITPKDGAYIGIEPEFIACLKGRVSEASLEALNDLWDGVRTEIARLSLSESQLEAEDPPLALPIPQAY